MEAVNNTQGNEPGNQNAAAQVQGQQTEELTAEKRNTLQKFLDELLGGGKEGAAAASEEKDGKSKEGSSKEKTFTQEDLDAAIATAKQQWENEAAEAARVKKLTPEEKEAEEQQKKDAEIESLKAQLLQKDLREVATKTLEKDGFPVGLADMLDYSSKERMEETLKNMTEAFQSSLAAAIQTRLKGKTPEGLGGAAASENMIRDQIAKNIRGE